MEPAALEPAAPCVVREAAPVLGPLGGGWGCIREDSCPTAVLEKMGASQLTATIETIVTNFVFISVIKFS
jgi:hypothetical protein